MLPSNIFVHIRTVRFLIRAFSHELSNKKIAWQLFIDHETKGSTCLTPALAKSRELRVATINRCVYEIAHNESVLSESMETKYPFSGHASNQSQSPAFNSGSRAIKRYSPRSIRSI